MLFLNVLLFTNFRALLSKNILLFTQIRLDKKRIDPLEVILINKAIINNGAIFLMDPEKVTCDRECIIAQLTIPSNTNSNMVINAQGRTNTPLSENINDDNWSVHNIEFPINTGH